MITLKEGLELAIKHEACKGNREAFEKALDRGDTLECYQIAFGNYEWLLEIGIIKESDIPELEKLAQGTVKTYRDNGRLRAKLNYKNGKRHGLCEEWDKNGQIFYRANYENGEFHGLYEEWDENSQLCSRVNYKNGEIVS